MCIHMHLPQYIDHPSSIETPNLLSHPHNNIPPPPKKTQNSLPDRELNSGVAEIIKYGLIRDPELFTWLEANVEKVGRCVF